MFINEMKMKRLTQLSAPHGKMTWHAVIMPMFGSRSPNYLLKMIFKKEMKMVKELIIDCIIELCTMNNY